MKTLGTVILSIFTIIFLIFGFSYWKSETKVKTIENPVKTENKEKNEKKEKDEKEPEKSNDHLALLDHVGTWPTDAVDEYTAALEKGDIYKFAIVGSQSLGDEDSWAEQLKSEFESVFDGTIEVELFEFDGLTTTELIDNGYQNIIDFKPNLVLFETLTLNDNSSGTAAQSSDNILQFIESFPDTTVILQPSHPIHNATVYPTQVDDQETYVSEQGYTYLNHWDSWPDYMTEEIQEYVVQPNQSTPTSKGHDVWFNYLKDYFIK